MADKGVNWGSFAEGSIKGAADAGTDFVEMKKPVSEDVDKSRRHNDGRIRRLGCGGFPQR